MKIIKNLTFAGPGGSGGHAAVPNFNHSRRRQDRDHRDAIITWTKHVTAFLPPGGEIFGTIAGVAGGDLGDGTLTGDAFNPVEVLPDGSITFEAEYHFIGSKHSFTVHFRTVQAPDNSGVITGVVTDGWLKGNVVVGTVHGALMRMRESAWHLFRWHVRNQERFQAIRTDFRQPREPREVSCH